MRGQAGSSVFSRSDFPGLARISFEVRDGAGEPAKGKTRKRQTPAGAEGEGEATVCGSTETVNIYGIARGVGICRAVTW